MAVAGLIVAAGRGRRLGGPVPKQYRTLGGEAVLARAARALLSVAAVTRLRIVIHADDRDLYERAMAGLGDARIGAPVTGGEERAGSVLAGLEALALEGAPEAVLIHDAARPFVAPETVGAVIAALDAAEGAVPALPVVDALWRAEGGLAALPVPREGLWRAQTPQGFRFAAILAAHRARAAGALDDAARALDDAAVARAAGLTVRVVEGDERAFKITTEADLVRAEERLGVDVRTGQGYDVHAFGPGDHVTLCGVRVPHGAGLVGHSDADVALHALTDALFGALGAGDIGVWFPPSDPQWKGAASEIFLVRAVELARERGFRITNADVTLVCERPKIGPVAGAMRAEVARMLGVEQSRVNVKATTSERLGFTGREEGIAAMATATLVRV